MKRRKKGCFFEQITLQMFIDVYIYGKQALKIDVILS